MPYPTVPALESAWNTFEAKTKFLANCLSHDHMSDIRKLMTAVSVIDLSLHDIYLHAEYVHEFTEQVINLFNVDGTNDLPHYQLWHEILKLRNQTPLQIQHHQLLDGECDFRFSLQLMEGKKPNGFKEVQVLNPKNDRDLKEAITAIHRLDCLAEGTSFAKLPLVNDTILSALMEYKDTICLIAKDQSDQIIGYCWGLLLRDVEIDQKQKVTIFWVMDLARDPDFFDKDVKVGDQLRVKMFELLKAKKECDFVGYQHLLNHKFHMSIVDDEVNDEEKIKLNNEEFSAKTTVIYNDTLGVYVRAHFIRNNDNNYPYPNVETLHPALLQFFSQAAHSTKDFILGGAAFFGRNLHQKLTHNMLNNSIDERLVNQVSKEQTTCDKNIFKDIILSNQWQQQGKSISRNNHVPATMQKLQPLVKDNEVDFATIKSCVNKRGNNIMRSQLTSLFYDVVAVADSPTFVVNRLLKDKTTPKEWIDLIGDQRKVLNK